MKMILAFPLLACALAGCATTADVELVKHSWQGATYDEVVQRWGTPSRETTLSDQSRVYTWISYRGGGLPASVGVFGGSGGSGVGVSIGLPGMGGGEWQSCERNLTFRNGRVVDQFWQGHPQLCSALTRQ